MLSPREREKRDRRDSRGDEREGPGSKRNRNESEEIEEIKTFSQYPFCFWFCQYTGMPSTLRIITS